MPTLQTKGFTDIVSGQAAAIQGSASGLVDFTIGSVLRAIVEAMAQVVLWLQALILQLLAATRASTSTGSDLDSWMADYGLTRIGATTATGVATFSRITSTQQGIVPVGTTIETADGSQQYEVAVDSTNPAYNSTLNGYVLAPGTSSVDVPITALVAGAAANATANTINTILDAVPGIDTVTNAAALTNGVDAESDAALRARFVTFIGSLSKATPAAVEYAALSIQEGVICTVQENVTYAGTDQIGHFSVVVDDGSGDPSDAFLNAVYAAVDLVRPITSTFEVNRPVIVTANVSLTIAVAAGYSKTVLQGLVDTAIQNYIGGLVLGDGLPYTRLGQVAYDASPGITNVSAVLLNSGTSDIAGNVKDVIKPGTITISAP